jgi:hypothetical protein
MNPKIFLYIHSFGVSARLRNPVRSGLMGNFHTPLTANIPLVEKPIMYHQREATKTVELYENH